jgi:hypothetical protein
VSSPSAEYVRPKLYLDIDGVVSVLGFDVEGLATATVHTLAGRRYEVHYSAALVGQLSALIDEHDVELIWLTSWASEPDAIEQLVDQLSVLRGGRQLKPPLPRMFDGLPRRWKGRLLVMDQRQRTAPFCSFDDEQAEWRAEARKAFNVPSLLMQPNALQGLTDMHIKSFREFLEGLPVKPQTPAGYTRSVADTHRKWLAIDTEFGLLSSSEVAERIDKEKEDAGLASDLRQKGLLLAVSTPDGFRYPGFQFADGEIRPVIHELVDAMREGGWSDESLIIWLCSPSKSFADGGRPVDHLGDPKLLPAAVAMMAVDW